MLRALGRTFHVAGWRQLLAGYTRVTRVRVPVQLPAGSRSVDGPSQRPELCGATTTAPTLVCKCRSSASDVLLLLARLPWAVRSIVSVSVMSVSDCFIEFCGCATPPCRRCGPASELSNMQPSLVLLA